MADQLPKGIRRRGHSYLVDVSHRGQRRTATCASLAEAKDKQDELRYELKAGGSVSTPSRGMWTIGQAYDHTCALPAPEGWRNSKAEDTAIKYARQVVEYFGKDRKLDGIDRPAIIEFTRQLEAKGNADSTINKKLSALSKMMSVAVMEGRLKASVKMPRRRTDSTRLRYLEPEEEQTLLAAFRARGEELVADIVAVLIDTGMRNGELWRLTPADVDFKTGAIHVWITKGGAHRTVYMTKRVRDILTERMEYPSIKHGFVRPNTQPFFPVDNFWLLNRWNSVRAALGYANDPDFVPYMCRHTCATRLVKAGVDLRRVQEWMGHKTIQVTVRYAKLAPTDLLPAVSALEGYHA